jgi:hypothetical protein
MTKVTEHDCAPDTCIQNNCKIMNRKFQRYIYLLDEAMKKKNKSNDYAKYVTLMMLDLAYRKEDPQMRAKFKLFMKKQATEEIKGGLSFFQRQAIDILLKQNKGKNHKDQVTSIKSPIADDMIVELTKMMEDERMMREEGENK